MSNTMGSRPWWRLRVGRVHFDVRWWVLALPMVLLAIRLGIWQMDRGALKETLERHYFDRLAMTPLACGALAPVHEPAFLRVRLEGVFVPGQDYLWDNRTHRGEAGYEVLTPFRCRDGTHVLVDRGWIGTGADRDHLPTWTTPSHPVALVGFVFVPAGTPVHFVDVTWPAGWPKRVGQLDIKRMAADTTLPRYPYPIVVDPDGAVNRDGAFVYNFEPATFSPMRHWGYAVQWFAIAAGIFAYLGFRSWQRP